MDLNERVASSVSVPQGTLVRSSDSVSMKVVHFYFYLVSGSKDEKTPRLAVRRKTRRPTATLVSASSSSYVVPSDTSGITVL